MKYSETIEPSDSEMHTRSRRCAMGSPLVFMKIRDVVVIVLCILAQMTAWGVPTVFVDTADNSLVSVMARGMGVTSEAALKDSFRDAVERAVGIFLDAEQQSENDQLIRDWRSC